MAAIKRRRVNWDKITYLSILTILVMLLARFVGYEALFVRAEGQIVAELFDVRFSRDVQIVEYLKGKDHVVEAGTPLFRYVVIEDVEPPASRTTDDELRWRERKLDLLERTEIKELDVQRERESVAYFRDRVTRIQEGLFLGIYTVDRLESYERRVAEHSANVEALTLELDVLRQRMRTLEAVQIEAREAPAISQAERVYEAPVAGRITDVFQSEWETVTNSDRILAISLTDSDRLFMRAVLTREDLQYIRERDVVSIEHANGMQSRGFVHHLFVPPTDHASPASRLAAEAKYVLADIYPLAEEDRTTWAAWKHLGAAITKRKL